MKFYQGIYNRLVESGMSEGEHWKPGSGIHKHHIIPRHAGGGDESSNITYLRHRDHATAHWLLWKIYGSKNDFCAYKALKGIGVKEIERVFVDTGAYYISRIDLKEMEERYDRELSRLKRVCDSL